MAVVPVGIHPLHIIARAREVFKTSLARAANDPSVFTIMEMDPTRAFFWFKAPTCN